MVGTTLPYAQAVALCSLVVGTLAHVQSPAVDVEALVQSGVRDKLCSLHGLLAGGCQHKLIHLLLTDEHPLVGLAAGSLHVGIHHVVREAESVVLAVAIAQHEGFGLGVIAHTHDVEHVGLTLYRLEVPCIISVAIHIATVVHEVVLSHGAIGAHGLDAVATLQRIVVSVLVDQAEGVTCVCQSEVCTPVLTATEEQALAYIIYIIGSVGIVGVGSLGDVSLWLAAHISLGAALQGVALACQAQGAEQIVDLGVRLTRVYLGLCRADGLLQVAFVLGLLAYGDGLQQDVHVTGIVEYGVDVCFQVLGILLHLGSVLVDLQLLAACLGQTVELGLHDLGECGLGLSQCDGSLQLLGTLVVVHFLHVDTAVIEASAKVLLDVSGDDILALAQIPGRDMHLLGVLSVGPSVILLQQVAVDIGLIGVIVAHIE